MKCPTGNVVMKCPAGKLSLASRKKRGVKCQRKEGSKPGLFQSGLNWGQSA